MFKKGMAVLLLVCSLFAATSDIGTITAYADTTSVTADQVTAVGYIETAKGATVYSEAKKSSSTVGTISFNTQVTYTAVSSKWSYVTSDGVEGYVLTSTISGDAISYNKVKIRKTSGFKSYMSYKAIKNKSSDQYKLQKKASTGTYGIRMVNGRYCIAVGTGVGAKIGQYVDVVLRNGTVIKCIVGDYKANSITDKKNLVTKSNGCVTEFIVSKSKLKSAAKTSGDISSCCSAWDSPVAYIKVYNVSVSL